MIQYKHKPTAQIFVKYTRLGRDFYISKKNHDSYQNSDHSDNAEICWICNAEKIPADIIENGNDWEKIIDAENFPVGTVIKRIESVYPDNYYKKGNSQTWYHCHDDGILLSGAEGYPLTNQAIQGLLCCYKYQVAVGNTEDNYPYFIGDRLWQLFDGEYITRFDATLVSLESTQIIKIFKKKENAEKYVKEHETKYSLQQINDAFQRAGYTATESIKILKKLK